MGQVKEHRVPGHAGVLLGIPGLDVLLHIGLGAKLDHIHVALDAQAVSLRRVAVGQQAGLDGVVPLSGAVHLEVPQVVDLQLVIRGGGSADLDGGNAVLVDVHIARLSYFVAVGNPLVGDAVGVDLRGAYGDVHGIGAAHLLACHHIHKLDGDGDGDRLIDGGQLHIAFGDTKELHSLGIGEAIQGLRGQLHTIISHPVRELLILRGSDFGDSPDDLVAAGVGNIFRLRIIEAIRPGALTVVELQGDGLCSLFVDGLNVQILEEIAVLIYSPIVYVAGQSRIIKCADTRSIRCLPAGKRCTCRRSSCGLRIGRSQRSSGVAGQIKFSKRIPSVTILRVLAEINMNGVTAFRLSKDCRIGHIARHHSHFRYPAIEGIGVLSIRLLGRSRAIILRHRAVSYVFVCLQHGAVLIYPRYRVGPSRRGVRRRIGRITRHRSYFRCPSSKHIGVLPVRVLGRGLAVVCRRCAVRHVFVFRQLGAVPVHPGHSIGVLGIHHFIVGVCAINLAVNVSRVSSGDIAGFLRNHDVFISCYVQPRITGGLLQNYIRIPFYCRYRYPILGIRREVLSGNSVR